MKTTIKDKSKWRWYCSNAGMTAIEWTCQVLGYERETETCHADVMRTLCIGGWSHASHYNGDHGLDNTKHAYDRLTEEVQLLAETLDKRLHELTAVENRLSEMAKQNVKDAP